MKERPILFSAPMVRALLDGSKTQTRRVVKGLNHAPHAGAVTARTDGSPMGGVCWDFGGPLIYCPHGQPGDRLWVRETFIAYGRWETRFSAKKKRDEWHFIDMTLECDRRYQYAADTPDVPLASGRGGALPGWYTRPAIFMPRAACRNLLEIVSVRVERLQDITEADARAEGVSASGWQPSYSNPDNAGGDESMSAADAFCELWESINGAGSWASNPWVWVLTFRRMVP